MKTFKYFAALALLLAAAAPAFADIAPPDPPKKKADRLGEVRRDLPYSQMTIERVEGLREARLQIPRGQLAGLGLAAGLEQNGETGGRLNGLGTAVAGVFLSLAVVLTGLMLVRSRRRGLAVGRAAAAVLVSAVAVGFAAVAAYANMAPPVGYRPQDPGTLIRAVSGQPLKGSIRVEIVEDGSDIKLLIPARSQRAGHEEE